ncbi:hypothetical protein MD484_g6801, partial [Candolleomyces efflorescens]
MPSISANQLLSLSILLMSTTLSNSMPIHIQWEDLFERQISNCYPLSVDQAKQLPGWAKLEQYAKDTWGEGGWNIVTNPEDFRDRPANACIEVARVPLQWAQQPQCSKSTAEIQGKSVGTTTKVAFDVEQGTEAKTSLSVTPLILRLYISGSSSITTSVSFNVGFSLPGGLDAGIDTSFSTTLTNEQSKTTENTSGKITKQHYEFDNEDGKQCKMTVETSDCAATAIGRIPVVAKGFVWFNYEDRRAPKADPNGGEHYKYSATIEQVLSEAERTSWIEVQGPVNTVTKANYETNCSKAGTGKKAAPKKKPSEKEKEGGKKPSSGASAPPKKGEPKTPEPKGKKPAKPSPQSAPGKPAPAKSGVKAPAGKTPSGKRPSTKPKPSEK